MNRVTDTIYGIAVGDAIGADLEFKSVIKPKDLQRAIDATVLEATDDTQMTLFAYEGLLAYESPKPRSAYLDWLITQDDRKDADFWSNPDPGYLLNFPEMFKHRAPGSTCLGSLRKINQSFNVYNDSKGNGTVMRASPYAVYAFLHGKSDQWLFENTKADALLTHKHPMAWQSSVFLNFLYMRLFSGYDLSVATSDTADSLVGICPDFVAYLRQYGSTQRWRTLSKEHSGWVAEEALFMAMCAVLHSDTFLDVMRFISQAIDCDTDTVMSIAGGIAVAAGMEVPDRLIKKLDVLAPIKFILRSLEDSLVL